MAHPLASVQDRFDRAQEHFDAIKSLLRAYYAQDPYIIEGETDFDVGATERVFYVEPPEERVNTLIGEMLHDLRSSLDHLARVFIETTGGTAGKGNAFPARQFAPAPNAKGIRKSLLRACRRDDMIQFVDDVQPYQLGNDFYLDGLWILHRLAIIDRHRHVVPRHVGMAKLNWNRRIRASVANQVKWEAHTIRSDEHGAELELRLKQPDPNIEGTATLLIVVEEPGEMGIDNPDPVALLDLLNDANNKTREIIDGARTRFFNTP